MFEKTGAQESRSETKCFNTTKSAKRTISTTGVYQVSPVQKKNKLENRKQRIKNWGAVRRPDNPDREKLKYYFLPKGICEEMNKN